MKVANLESKMNPEEKFMGKYRIGSTRLKGYDYGSDGGYFVTICTNDRENYFGEIRNGIMGLNDLGLVAHKCWQAIPDHFPFVVLDEFVVMPNHIHGVLFIGMTGHGVETQDFASLREIRNKTKPMGNEFGPQSRNLASIIRGYKIGVTKYARENGLVFSWQSRFHDRIIRNEQELDRIRRYIRNNPLKWALDRNNPFDFA